jgi:riboflavin synthase
METRRRGEKEKIDAASAILLSPRPRVSASVVDFMFTGIIEELGHMRSIEKRGEGARLVVEARLVIEGTQEGDSIAVNGVCLTAIDVRADSFSADGSQETLQRSTLGTLRAGSRVNLERAVTPSTRLGGHIVQGHVDGRGRFLNATEHGGSWTVRIAYPPEMARYLVFKGSVAVEGISLTVAALTDEYFEIAIIPKTWNVTNLSHLRPNDEVNLEADIIAKYVERILTVAPEIRAGNQSSLTIEKLAELGYK